MSGDQSYTNEDLIRALGFFDGLLEPINGLVRYRPLTAAEEAESRGALVRVLKSESLPREIVERLVGVFAPDGPETAAKRAELKFRARKGGRPPNPYGAAQLIIEVYLRRIFGGYTAEAAIAEVASKFNLSYEAVRDHLSRNQELRDSIANWMMEKSQSSADGR